MYFEQLFFLLGERLAPKCPPTNNEFCWVKASNEQLPIDQRKKTLSNSQTHNIPQT
jgi:hypothetical protein